MARQWCATRRGMLPCMLDLAVDRMHFWSKLCRGLAPQLSKAVAAVVL